MFASSSSPWSNGTEQLTIASSHLDRCIVEGCDWLGPSRSVIACCVAAWEINVAAKPSAAVGMFLASPVHNACENSAYILPKLPELCDHATTKHTDFLSGRHRCVSSKLDRERYLVKRHLKSLIWIVPIDASAIMHRKKLCEFSLL
jgi:hypothetical protein